MLFRFSLLVLFYVLVGRGVDAQGAFPFAEGYLVTVQGDTLRGEIAELPELLATREVHFRKAPGAEVRTFAPWTVRTYSLSDGRTYVSRSLQPAEDLAADDFFLLTLVQGDLTLYAFSFEDPPIEQTSAEGFALAYRPQRFAVETADGEIYPLYERRILLAEYDASVGRTDRQYVRQLAAVFGDCPDEQRRVGRLRFTQRQITAAVARFNSCIGSEAVLLSEEASRRRADVVMDVGVRLNVGAGTMRRAGTETEPGRGAAYSVGVQTLVRPLVVSTKLAAPIEVRLGYTSLANEDAARPLDVEDFDRLRAGLTVGVQYLFPVASYEAFAGTGVGSSYLFGEKRRGCIMVFICETMPSWESSMYFEMGATAPVSRQLRSISIGTRFEIFGIGHPNPFARNKSRWENRTFSAFTIVRL